MNRAMSWANGRLGEAKRVIIRTSHPNRCVTSVIDMPGCIAFWIRRRTKKQLESCRHSNAILPSSYLDYKKKHWSADLLNLSWRWTLDEQWGVQWLGWQLRWTEGHIKIAVFICKTLTGPAVISTVSGRAHIWLPMSLQRLEHVTPYTSPPTLGLCAINNCTKATHLSPLCIPYAAQLELSSSAESKPIEVINLIGFSDSSHQI